MSSLTSASVRSAAEQIFRNESRRVFASLVRLLRDFDLAEEALHEAFATALERWEAEGLPENPRTWLISTGRFKAIDALRRRGRLDEIRVEWAERREQIAASNMARSDEDIEDDRLRLIFTRCHPAIDPLVQVPLTLREVCGLTTEEIASAFLVAPSTMAQRLVRGKSKIRDAGIPIAIPAAEDLAERLESVLSVVYLVFNEGYSASSGGQLTRADLSGEAIRLGRLIAELLPDAEAFGLLALMVLQESRRSARATSDGDIILLEEQDRTLWDRRLIQEGQQLVERARRTGRFGAYTIQASIAAVHAGADTPEATNWKQIVSLYDALLSVHASPVVELNRAVALAMDAGPAVGLALIDGIMQRGELVDYHLTYAARADLCRRSGQTEQAFSNYQQALKLARQEPEKRFLLRRIREISENL